MGRFHVFPSGWWRCCAMYDTTRCSGAEGIHLHLLPIALFSNHVPCGLFPFMCFEWWCHWNWVYARYHFNQWMRFEKASSVHSYSTVIVQCIFLTLASNQIVVHNYMYCYFEMFNNIPKHRSSSMNSLLLPLSSVFQHLSPRCVVSPSRGAVGGDAHVRTLRRLDRWSQSDCKARGCSMRIWWTRS